MHFRRSCRVQPVRTKDSLKFSLSDEERRDAEKTLEERISDQLRYDMAVRLVGMPTGGYNIVAYNRRTRDEVRGLCDPSFVAFQAAYYTYQTGWKSRALHIWIAPREEGWSIRTEGSRQAKDFGVASSGRLGALLGVVNVKGFRKELEKHFVRLTPSGTAIRALPVEAGGQTQ